MAITAKCPNGHVLKVKDEFAGKSGLCPHCHSRILVPMPVHPIETEGISDDEVLGLLGPPGDMKTKSAASPPTNYKAPASSILKNQKVCLQCGHLASIAFANCPRCGTPLPNLESAKT